jgi:hypothetical protein
MCPSKVLSQAYACKRARLAVGGEKLGQIGARRRVLADNHRQLSAERLRLLWCTLFGLGATAAAAGLLRARAVRCCGGQCFQEVLVVAQRVGTGGRARGVSRVTIAIPRGDRPIRSLLLCCRS